MYPLCMLITDSLAYITEHTLLKYNYQYAAMYTNRENNEGIFELDELLPTRYHQRKLLLKP